MMKLRYLAENFALARLALERYAHDEQTLDLYLRHFRISSNAVYPYANKGARCFLRLAPVQEKELEQVQAEIEYIRYLNAKGFSAMKPVADGCGRLESQLSSPWGSYCVSAFESVPGCPAEDVLPDPDCLYEMGRTLGRMHQLSRGYQPTVFRHSHHQVVQQIQRMLEDNDAPDGIVQKLDELVQELDGLPVNSETYGLLHYDFEPDNVFWDESTRTCSVIDFDDSMYGWFALDVVQALDALAEDVDDTQADVFMQGYRSASPYTAEMEAQQPLMRRFVQLRKYARLLHCLGDEIADPPEWMTDLCMRLNDARQHLENRILHG